MLCRFAAIAVIGLCAGVPLAGRADAEASDAQPEPHYIDVLGSWVRPDSYLGGVQQESSADVGSGNVKTLGVAGQPTKLILDFPTSESFDAARIRFTNLVGTQPSLDVYAICVGEP